MKNRIIIFISVFVFAFSSFAQDIHLSQFYTADHLLNPANVGDFDGDFRFIGNYRNQWRQINKKALNTLLLSYDQAFRHNKHEFDYGILIANDQFTGFNTKTTKLLASLGYVYNLKGHKIRFGIQPGIVFKSTDETLQTFPEQWDYATGEFSLEDNGETTIKYSENYFDLNVGVQWSKKMGKFEPRFGFALNHITRPKDTFFDEHTERLKVRKVFHYEGDYSFSKKLALQPKLLWMWTGNANDLVFGTNLKFFLARIKIPSVFVGVFYRHGASRTFDAIIPKAGFSYKRFDFGLSYDVNVSALSQNVDRKGTFEFSVIYTGFSSKPVVIALPCDRY